MVEKRRIIFVTMVYLLVISTGFGSSNAQETFTFQQGVNGYEGTTDAHIFANKKTNNAGNENMFEATGNGTEADAKHALIRFDLSSVPSGTQIDFAKLSLYFTMRRTSQSQDKKLGAFRVNRPWGEGVGNDPGGLDGRPAVAGEVSWNFAMSDTEPWAVPGANRIPDDRDGAPENVQTFSPSSSADAWYLWDITEMVRFWVANPDSNFGLILREPTVSSFAGIIDFASSEFETVTLRPILSINTQVVTAVEERGKNFIPITFDLKQNYPNPFNPSTTIRYELKKRERVTLKIYNLMGQEVATLVEDEKSAGPHEIVFDASGLASGIYVYTVQAGQFTAARKMVLTK